jgi:predicted protein tyrosine phosphatase
MINVTIYSDLQKTHSDQYDVLVKRIEDYVQAYATIINAVYTNRQLIVVVQNKHCLSYLKKMQERYKDNVQIKVHSPKIKLAELICLDIPDYITDEDIIQDQLVNNANEVFTNKGMNLIF